MRKKYHEFVPTYSGNSVFFANQVFHATTKFFKNLIASMVAKRVVNILEVIEIYK